MPSRPFLRALLPAYRALVGEADRWFAQALQVHKDDGVQCGRGCSRCCLGLFDISAADELLVAEGYRQASPDQQQQLRFRARAQLGEIGLRSPEWSDPWRVESLTEERFDELCESLSDARCAALSDDGSCLIYDHRPLICRLHGLPMYDPSASRDCGGACDLNFPPYDLESKPALHFPHADFVRRETELLDAIEGPAHGSHGASTVVAAALWRAAVEEESHDER